MIKKRLATEGNDYIGINALTHTFKNPLLFYSLCLTDTHSKLTLCQNTVFFTKFPTLIWMPVDSNLLVLLFYSKCQWTRTTWSYYIRGLEPLIFSTVGLEPHGPWDSNHTVFLYHKNTAVYLGEFNPTVTTFLNR